jgi:Zn-dependent protease
MTCPQCGVEIPPNVLVCPSCRALVHAAELKTLAANAEAATAAGNYSDALVYWRRALELLPPASAQYGVINVKIGDLVQRLENPTAAELPKKPKWANKGGMVGALGLLLWKFKFIALFLLTKAKLLLLGLSKAGTVLSMLVSIWFYSLAFGWPFAVGFVLSIYVHEMGHVYQLTRYGIKATAPMFIPGLGALIRLKQYPANPHEEARVGLAGPVWGLATAGACYAAYLATNLDLLAALAKTGAWLNMFNLIPVWQLDGSHAFKALSRFERIGVAVIALAMWALTEQGLLLLIVIVAAFRCFQKGAPEKRDFAISTEFAFLILTLSLLSTIQADAPGRPQPVVEGVAAISKIESRRFAGFVGSFDPGRDNLRQTWPPRR